MILAFKMQHVSVLYTEIRILDLGQRQRHKVDGTRTSSSNSNNCSPEEISSLMWKSFNIFNIVQCDQM